MVNNELKVGSPIPDFSLPSNMGGEVKLSDYRGKKVVLFFVRAYE
jgi:peroxiredoxin Q/BCP